MAHKASAIHVICLNFALHLVQLDVLLQVFVAVWVEVISKHLHQHKLCNVITCSSRDAAAWAKALLVTGKTNP